MTDNAGPQFSNPTNAGAPGAIRGDWRCIACEYPLIGLDPTGVCPECGTRLALSLRDDGLSNSNPLWILRLSNAVGLFFFSVLAELLVKFAFYPPLNLMSVTILSRCLSGVWILIPAIVWLAVWQLATPEYVALGQYRSTRMCWAIRILATLSISHWLWLPILETSLYLPLCFYVLVLAKIVLVWLYLRNLARRIPDSSLVKQVPLLIGCLLLMEFVAVADSGINLAFHTHFTQAAPGTISVITLAALSYEVYLLARFFNQFTACANQAMQNYLSERDAENRARTLSIPKC